MSKATIFDQDTTEAVEILAEMNSQSLEDIKKLMLSFPKSLNSEVSLTQSINLSADQLYERMMKYVIEHNENFHEAILSLINGLSVEATSELVFAMHSVTGTYLPDFKGPIASMYEDHLTRIRETYSKFSETNSLGFRLSKYYADLATYLLRHRLSNNKILPRNASLALKQVISSNFMLSPNALSVSVSAGLYCPLSVLYEVKSLLKLHGEKDESVYKTWDRIVNQYGEKDSSGISKGYKIVGTFKIPARYSILWIPKYVLYMGKFCTKKTYDFIDKLRENQASVWDSLSDVLLGKSKLPAVEGLVFFKPDGIKRPFWASNLPVPFSITRSQSFEEKLKFASEDDKVLMLLMNSACSQIYSSASIVGTDVRSALARVC